ncbi:MAG: hypothetical protein GEU73_12730 [Chloroflexi bacterium]|nr:hypothetical protein [Chloroflexota bacterium]
MPARSRHPPLALRKPVSAGLVAGAAVGLLWVAARHYAKDRADQILDWEQITSVAVRFSGAAAPISAERRASVEADYARILRDVSDPLAAYTGIDLSVAKTEARVLDRDGWIHANVRNFRDLLDPLEALYREKSASSRFDLPGVTAVGRLFLSAEVGVVLGYLARRVLGQYDISLIGARSAEPGKLYFVEPNIQATQLMLGLPHREFRAWLALHEATHAHEFEGHPWVRDYLNGMLQAYLQSMVDDLRGADASLRLRLARAADRLSTGGSLFEALMTPYQKGLVSRLQALMCLIEGYSNHVMNAVGRSLLPHFAEIERRVEQRSRERTAAERLFLRLTGLQMKFDQYRLGGAFVDHVQKARGTAFMNHVWRGPEYVPTEEEIREPTRWVARMELGGPA